MTSQTPNSEKIQGWTDIEKFAIIIKKPVKDEEIQALDKDVTIGDILILKYKDDCLYKDQWFFGSSFSNQTNRGFIHSGCLYIFEQDKKKEEKRTKKDNPKPGELLVNYIGMIQKKKTKDNYVKEIVNYWTPYIEDPLCKEIIQTSVDLCKISFKDTFEKDEQIREKALEVIGKMLKDLKLLSKNKDLTTKTQIQQRMGIYLEELGLDLFVQSGKANDKLKIADESNTTSVSLFKLHCNRHQIVEKTMAELNKRTQVKTIERGLSFQGNIVQDFSALPITTETQIHMNVSNINIKSEDPISIYFYLIPKSHYQGWPITESFKIDIGPNLLDKSFSCIFRDLEKKHFQKQLFMVCKIVREGGLVNEKKKKDTLTMKRPVSIGLFEFSFSSLQSLINGNPISQTISFYNIKDEANFFKFHNDIITAYFEAQKTNLKTSLMDLAGFEKLDGNLMLDLSLFQGHFDQILEQNRFEFSTSLAEVKALDIPEIVHPSYERNDLYIHLDRVNLKGVNEGFLSHELNTILCSVKVYIEKEKELILLKECFLPSAQMNRSLIDSYETSVLYHVSNPTWNETIKLLIEPKDLERSIIVFNYYHLSSKMSKDVKLFPVAFSYLKWSIIKLLQRDHRDLFEPLKLNVYKYEKDIELKLLDFDKDNEKKKKLESKGEFKVWTLLLSTKVTQNDVLKLLFSASSNDSKAHIKQVLSKFLSIDFKFYIIFLKDILDSLFRILDFCGDSIEVSPMIFKSICSFISIIISNFSEYKTVLDNYITNNLLFYPKIFNNTIMFFEYFNESIDKFEEEDMKYWKEILKSWDYLFQILVITRNNDDLNSGKEDFQIKVRKNIFKALEKIFSSQQVYFQQLQEVLLEYSAGFWENIFQIFPDSECAKFCLEFLTLLLKMPNTPLLLSKRVYFMNSIVKGELFKRDSCREVLLPKLFTDLTNLLDDVRIKEVKSEKERALNLKVIDLYVRIILNLFSCLEKRQFYYSQYLKKKLEQNQMDDICLLIQKFSFFIEPFVTQLNDEETFLIDLKKETLGDIEFEKLESKISQKKQIITQIEQNIKTIEKIRMNIFGCYAASLNLVTDDVFNHLLQIEDYPNDQMVNDILTSIKFVENNRSLIPNFWNTYVFFLYQSITRGMTNVSNGIIKLAKDSKLTHDICQNYFDKVKNFIYSNELMISKWPSFKKSKINETFRGDYRMKNLVIFQQTWNQMGDIQNEFVPKIIDYVFPSIVYIDDTTKIVIDFISSVLEKEFNLFGSLERSEPIMQKNLASSQLKTSQVDQFIDQFASSISSEKMKDVFGLYIRSLKKLMSYKREIESVLDSEEDRKTDACIGVIKYFLQSNNQNLLFSYSSLLSKVHESLKNYTEAAICLLSFAKNLSFTSYTIHDALNDLPEQKESDRKETLYLQSISLFEEGLDYENAIRLCKELRTYYEEITYDYFKLGGICKKLDQNYQAIMNDRQFYAPYYFVGKYGQLWGKEEGDYIYKGNTGEDVVEFTNRLKKADGNFYAEFIQVKPTQDKMDSNKKYIETYSVLPFTDEQYIGNPLKVNRNIHPKISSYNYNNNIHLFIKERRYDSFKDRTGIKKLPPTYNDYKNLHREIIVFHVENNFPTIQRRQKIIKVEKIELTPLQNAIRDIEYKNKELTELVVTFEKDSKPNTKQMSMLLNGVLDAAVNGGIEKYINAFFSRKFIAKADEKIISDLKRFQDCLSQQLIISKQALVEWRKVQNKQGMGLLEHLEKRWKEMQNKVQNIVSNPLNVKQTLPEDDVDSDEELVKELKKE